MKHDPRRAPSRTPKIQADLRREGSARDRRRVIDEGLRAIMARARSRDDLRRMVTALNTSLELSDGELLDVFQSLAEAYGRLDAMDALNRLPASVSMGESLLHDAGRLAEASTIEGLGDGVLAKEPSRRATSQERSKVKDATGLDPGPVAIHGGPFSRRLVDSLGFQGAVLGKSVFIHPSRAQDEGLLLHELTHTLHAPAAGSRRGQIPRVLTNHGAEHQADTVAGGQRVRGPMAAAGWGVMGKPQVHRSVYTTRNKIAFFETSGVGSKDRRKKNAKEKQKDATNRLLSTWKPFVDNGYKPARGRDNTTLYNMGYAKLRKELSDPSQLGVVITPARDRDDVPYVMFAMRPYVLRMGSSGGRLSKAIVKIVFNKVWNVRKSSHLPWTYKKSVELLKYLDDLQVSSSGDSGISIIQVPVMAEYIEKMGAFAKSEVRTQKVERKHRKQAKAYGEFQKDVTQLEKDFGDAGGTSDSKVTERSGKATKGSPRGKQNDATAEKEQSPPTNAKAKGEHQIKLGIKTSLKNVSDMEAVKKNSGYSKCLTEMHHAINKVRRTFVETPGGFDASVISNDMMVIAQSLTKMVGFPSSGVGFSTKKYLDKMHGLSKALRKDGELSKLKNKRRAKQVAVDKMVEMRSQFDEYVEKFHIVLKQGHVSKYFTKMVDAQAKHDMAKMAHHEKPLESAKFAFVEALHDVAEREYVLNAGSKLSNKGEIARSMELAILTHQIEVLFDRYAKASPDKKRKKAKEKSSKDSGLAQVLESAKWLDRKVRSAGFVKLVKGRYTDMRERMKTLWAYYKLEAMAGAPLLGLSKGPVSLRLLLSPKLLDKLFYFAKLIQLAFFPNTSRLDHLRRKHDKLGKVLDKKSYDVKGGASGFKHIKARWYPLESALKSVVKSDVPAIASIPMHVCYAKTTRSFQKKDLGPLGKIEYKFYDLNTKKKAAKRYSLSKYNHQTGKHAKEGFEAAALTHAFESYVKFLKKTYPLGRLVIINPVTGKQEIFKTHAKKPDFWSFDNIVNIAGTLLSAAFPLVVGIPFLLYSMGKTVQQWQKEVDEETFSWNADKVMEVVALIGNLADLGLAFHAVSKTLKPINKLGKISDEAITAMMPLRAARTVSKGEFFLVGTLKGISVVGDKLPKVYAHGKLIAKINAIKSRDDIPFITKRRLVSALLGDACKNGAMFLTSKLVGAGAAKAKGYLKARKIKKISAELQEVPVAIKPNSKGERKYSHVLHKLKKELGDASAATKAMIDGGYIRLPELPRRNPDHAIKRWFKVHAKLGLDVGTLSRLYGPRLYKSVMKANSFEKLTSMNAERYYKALKGYMSSNGVSRQKIEALVADGTLVIPDASGYNNFTLADLLGKYKKYGVSKKMLMNTTRVQNVLQKRLEGFKSITSLSAKHNAYFMEIALFREMHASMGPLAVTKALIDKGYVPNIDKDNRSGRGRGMLLYRFQEAGFDKKTMEAHLDAS